VSRQVGYSCVGLVSPKFPVNVASVLRACHCYNAAALIVQGRRYQRHGADTPKQWKHMPLFHTDDIHTMVPFACVPVGVDLVDDAEPLPEFVHPERALYIFGPEDGTLGQKVLSWCKHKVYVPTTHCMNLAATVNVVLYDRKAKVS